MIKINVIVCGSLLLLCFAASANGQKSTAAAPSTSSPSPAPAPATEYVNLAALLSVAGPFHNFMKYLESTKLINSFQDQANKIEEGITLFVPKDEAFSSLKKPSLSNLTQDQLKSVLSFHVIPHYYTLSDFRNLSLQNHIPLLLAAPITISISPIKSAPSTSSLDGLELNSSASCTPPIPLQSTRPIESSCLKHLKMKPTPAILRNSMKK